MAKKLHETQKSLLQLLRDNIDDPLTVRELQEILNVSSPSVIQHHIYQLEKNGYLLRNPTNPRDYQILSDEPEKKIAYVNLYGLAQCGPSGSILDGNPIERIPIATKILGFSPEKAFMVKARGNSMSPTIKDKDLVIARRSNIFDNGQIAVCVNDGEALIKKIYKTADNIILRSTNEKFEPFLASADFHVEGIVKGVFSYLPSHTE